MEACDEAMPVECTAVGYYGGTATCGQLCSHVDERTCVACASDITCAAFERQAHEGIVASGTRLAMLEGQGVSIVENGKPTPRPDT